MYNHEKLITGCHCPYEKYIHTNFLKPCGTVQGGAASMRGSEGMARRACEAAQQSLRAVMRQEQRHESPHDVAHFLNVSSQTNNTEEATIWQKVATS